MKIPYGLLCALLCSSILIACGGGGGGGSNQSSPPPSSISLSSTQVSLTATILDIAPVATVQLTLANPPINGAYGGVSNTSNGVASVQFLGTSNTAATITINLKLPAQLGVGIYNDTVTVMVCYDALFTKPVSNSPQTISIQYTVTQGITPPPTSHQVTINWAANREASVNKVGGGYKVSISGQPVIDVPYPLPTSTIVTLMSGNYNVTITAYSALNSSTGLSGTSTSLPSSALLINVPY
jgi:hypothetical protein